MTNADAAQLAINLARNCGYAVFPCGENKKPTRPKNQGGTGLKDASTDPDIIRWLWQYWPGPLIGVATAGLSGISVLDIDIKSDAARAWWLRHEHRLPETRTYRTRSGGMHLLFQHTAGVRNVEGKPVSGVDVRGQGGYFIFWFAAGYECLDLEPPAAWPSWLTTFFWPPPKSTSVRTHCATLSDNDLERVKQRAIDLVSGAADGQKHYRLRAAARLLGGIQHRAGFSDSEAAQWLINALPAGVKDAINAERTALWGLDNGRAAPIEPGRRA
jgi:hypothetical protein